jgi:hypothetical protein
MLDARHTKKTPSWTKGAVRSRSQCRLASQAYKTKQNERRSTPSVEPKCLEQTIGRLKSGEPMQCPSCDVGININTNRLANAADEVHKPIEKVPPEITIEFF